MLCPDEQVPHSILLEICDDELDMGGDDDGECET